MNGVEQRDDLYQSISAEDFYAAMVNGVNVTTSQPNMQEFLNYFETFLEEGKDILHISLSSGLSGTHQSAVNAANIARERYPERKIYIVDSLAAASGIGLFMDKLADLRDAGMGLEELRDWAEENKLRLHHWFFTTDLTFFIKGGRVSKTAGAVAGVLIISWPIFISSPVPKDKRLSSLVQASFSHFKRIAPPSFSPLNFVSFSPIRHKFISLISSVPRL